MIRHLICGNDWSWLFKLNLTNETLDWGRKRPVDFSVGKIQLVSFDWSNNFGTINVKMNWSFIEEKSFKIMGLSFSSKLDWVCYIVSITKAASKKFGAQIHSRKFLSPEIAFYLYKSTIQPCMEYSSLACANTSSCYLNMRNQLTKLVVLLSLHLLLLLNPWLIIIM